MKRKIAVLLALMMLTGCADGYESDTSQITTSSTKLTTSAMQTRTVSTQEQTAETSEIPHEAAPEEPLLQLIRSKIKEGDPDASPDVVTVFFEDFNGDGTRDLIAADGGMEIHDGEEYYYGSLWQISEDKSFPIEFRAWDGSAMTDFRQLIADGDKLFSYELYSDAEYNRTELWRFDEAWHDRIFVDGSALLHITQLENCLFTALSTGYGANTDGTGRIYLPYELHYNSDHKRLVQYRYREITFDEFLEYCTGYGQSILDMIAAEGSEKIAYYLSENDKLVINYTLGEQQRYALCEWKNGTLSVDMDEGNLGNFPVDITFEQQRLEQLILDSMTEEQRLDDGRIVYSLFGDLDDDGTEEIVCAYSHEGRMNDLWCFVWFASGDTVEFIGAGGVGDTISTPCGTFLSFPRVGPWGTVDTLMYIHESSIYNAMPEDIGGFTYVEYDAESGYFHGNERMGYNDDSGVYYKYRMGFDHESHKLVILETTTR